MNKFNGLGLRLTRKFSTNFLKNFAINTDQFNSNMKHLDKMVITIYNPNTTKPGSMFRSNIFNAEINFQKDSLNIYKSFASNDYDKLMNDIKSFLNKEIKI